ncbi:hypothetical protein E0L36_02250 [Streptomyces sp. AJS327]|nr:hypothetical protein [Streptomyces sp. AJS327]
MWEDMAQASKTSDASSPQLDDHAQGAALRLLKFGLTQNAKNDVVSRGRPRIAPRVIDATEERVKLRDCVDDTKWLLYKRDGTLKNHVPGSHDRADAIVEVVKGEWKVTSLYLHEAGSC